MKQFNFGAGWNYHVCLKVFLFQSQIGIMNGVVEMESNAEIYVGLSVWKAATLYAGFIENRMPTEGLAEFISIKNSFSALNQKKWRSLHKAVEKGDINKIKKIALEPVEGDVPWPKQWVTIGEEFKRAYAIG